MKSSVFNYPYDKVFRRTQGALSKLGMKIVSSDAIKGKIKASRPFSLKEPSMEIELQIEKLEHQNTRLTVKNIVVKRQFFHKNKGIDEKETELLDALSAII